LLLTIDIKFNFEINPLTHMNDLFLNTFLSVFQGIAKIFIIAGIAGILVWRKVIKQSFIDGLSNIMVYAFLPAMIFSTIISGFNPQQEKYWWTLPLAAIIITLAGLGISALTFIPDFKKHRNILPLSCMPNAAYLVLPIGEFLYPDQFEKFAVYCFLIVLGLNPVFWSVGLYFVTDRKKGDFQWKQLLTPPFIINIISVLIVLSSLHKHIPTLVIDSIDLLGKATVPSATFILGATLVSTLKTLPGFWETFRITFVKFVIIPLMSIAILYILGTYKKNALLADEMIIQSAAAPATALIIQVRTFGGDLKKIGGITFISYLITLFAIPLWLTVWKILTN
jgi:predicted permease